MTTDMLREWLVEQGYEKASDGCHEEEIWVRYEPLYDATIRVMILLDRYVAISGVLDAWSMYEISKLSVRGDVIDSPKIRSVLI